MSGRPGTPPLSRREFLATGIAASAAALVVGFRLDGGLATSAFAADQLSPSPFDAWVRIGRDGAVTLVFAKSEMGQGIMTSLPMILADELDVDWASVTVEQAICNPAIYSHQTGGSTAIRTSWTPLRQAGAAARQMLVAAAAARWKVAPDSCATERGAVRHPASGRRLAYGDLVEEAARLPVPDLAAVRLKAAGEQRFVGTAIRRVDIPAKVNGSATFGLDVRVAGMLHAVIARPPTFGARLKRFDATRAKAVPGVRHVLEIRPVPQAFTLGGVAVAADSTWAALRGRDALTIEWEPGPSPAESSAALDARMAALNAAPGTVVRNEGDAAAALGAAARRLEATYELPFLAHAPMEPMNCTVDVREDRAEAWAPAQDSSWVLRSVHEVTGLPDEKIRVHTTFLGGGFGRRAHGDFAVEAAQVSQGVKAPVQVAWTREDDIRHDFYRPAARHVVRAGLDPQGRPTAWMHRMASPAIAAMWSAMFGGAPPESSEVGGIVNLPYAIPNLRVEYSLAASPVPVMWWRSVAHSGNAFVVESFLDEIAHAAGVDPLELRLKLLAGERQVTDPYEAGQVLETQRLAAVIRLAAEKAGWGAPLPPGRGRGIAAHFCFYSYACHVVEASAPKGGQIQVHRVVTAVDCGRVVNPDGVAAQMESAVVFGLSAALKGKITVADGRVEQGNFDGYDVVRMGEAPLVETYLVPSDAPPTGTGEPGLPPVAPALANALFAATGKRVRRLPITPQDLA